MMCDALCAPRVRHSNRRALRHSRTSLRQWQQDLPREQIAHVDALVVEFDTRQGGDNPRSQFLDAVVAGSDSRTRQQQQRRWKMGRGARTEYLALIGNRDDAAVACASTQIAIVDPTGCTFHSRTAGNEMRAPGLTDPL
jgi:hypothetical protein